MESAEVEDLFDENAPYLAIVQESEMISIKKRTAMPSCVDSNDEAYQRRSVYYSEKTPYKYTLEACLKSCKAHAFRECGYLYPYIPVQSVEYEKGATLSYSPGSNCSLKPINMEACNCPIPCRKIQYRVLRDKNELFDIPCDQKRQRKSQSQKNECKIDEYDSESQVTIHFRSSVYQSIEEQLTYGLYEFLGILGGNMSLWIGLCIISLLEVVELCIKVILTYVRSFQNQP